MPRDGKTIGEVVNCTATLKQGASHTAEELMNFCRQRITNHKCPKEIEFGQIPQTSVGKVQKYLLRQRERQHFQTIKGG